MQNCFLTFLKCSCKVALAGITAFLRRRINFTLWKTWNNDGWT